MIVPSHGLPTLSRGHSHDADMLEVHVAKFKMALRRRAAQENTGMAEIYRSEEVRHPEAARVFPGFLSIRASMYRRRKAGTPPIPDTLHSYAEFLMMPQ